MKTMALKQAEKIFQIVCEALQDTTHRHTPLSSLKGNGIHEIMTALKLKVANEFLLYEDLACSNPGGSGDYRKKFADGVKFYEAGPGLITLNVVPDDQADAVGAKRAFDAFGEEYLKEETVSSFAAFCRSVGSMDELYWQKIYTRLGLEYTSSSPRGREIAPPESC